MLRPGIDLRHQLTVDAVDGSAQLRHGLPLGPPSARVVLAAFFSHQGGLRDAALELRRGAAIDR